MADKILGRQPSVTSGSSSTPYQPLSKPAHSKEPSSYLERQQYQLKEDSQMLSKSKDMDMQQAQTTQQTIYSVQQANQNHFSASNSSSLMLGTTVYKTVQAPTQPTTVDETTLEGSHSCIVRQIQRQRQLV